MKIFPSQVLALAFSLHSLAPSYAAELQLGQGTLAGEVTQTTAILQTRLTASTGLVNGDVPGATGGGRFEIATEKTFQNALRTPWQTAVAERDFILKAAVTGLQPGTRYYYRVIYGANEAQTKSGPVCELKSLPAADANVPVNFTLLSCGLFAAFETGTASGGKSLKGAPGYEDYDRRGGYPVIEDVIKLRPDFCIFGGDNVYYDYPRAAAARTPQELRKKWHEQYVQPRYLRLFAQLPTYWLKDDHDYRKNDADATGSYAPSHDLGIAMFREQVPIVDPSNSRAVTYRTHRFGRNLQLWFVEGRDYRSPNTMLDGPNKTLWGAEQKAWLQRTLRASDATYKILVSPTPMIGPDDAYKRDNHVNLDGFHHEGESFFSWLKEAGIAPDRFYIICGDRHWKYHSIHPSGYQEFGSGALNLENARHGRSPGDPKSTDPQAVVRQPYTDATPTGGFLNVRVRPAVSGNGVKIEFSHYNEKGNVVYQLAHSTY